MKEKRHGFLLLLPGKLVHMAAIGIQEACGSYIRQDTSTLLSFSSNFGRKYYFN
jgi:hypothetical protein